MQQLLPMEASLIAMFILLLATTVESSLRQAEFDWEKFYYASDIVELFGNSDDKSTLPRGRRCNELQNCEKFYISTIRNCFIAELCDCAR
jgi:hypothetical protein